MGFFSKSEREARALANTERYMAFKIGGQVYGAPLAIVSEVTKLGEISSLPDESGEILGVMEYKGNAVIVLNLSVRLGLKATEMTEKTCVLVVERGGEAESGCLIDEPLSIIEIPREQMEVKSMDGFRLCRLNDKNILLPDTEKFFINQF